MSFVFKFEIDFFCCSVKFITIDGTKLIIHSYLDIPPLTIARSMPL